MHVDIVPNRSGRPTVLLRTSFREDGKVKHKTIANISDLSPERIVAVKRALRGDFDALGYAGVPHGSEQGPQFGALYLLHEIAKDIGLEKILGRLHYGKLALLLVLAQVIFKGSRAGVVTWAENQALREALGLTERNGLNFTEDTLYEVLDELARERLTLQVKLFKKRGKDTNRLFLYDVTSSYLEGQCNEFANWGYNRDKKTGKKQIVIGLLTDKTGDPVAVEVFQGNTSDPSTVLRQIELLKNELKVKNVVFVGDRGMIKSAPTEAIHEAGFQFITAITKPQIESLIRQGVFQLELFEDHLGEIQDEGVRYVFRRNPQRAREMEASRLERIGKVEKLGRELSAYLAGSQRRRPDVALKKIQAKIGRLGIGAFTSARMDGLNVIVEIDEEALREKARLDGVYVIKTDTASHDLDKETVHRVYKSLYQVETDFRTMKSGLEIRPVFVRKKSRTRGHVLVVMLALILVRELKKRLAAINLDVSHAIMAMDGWCLLRERIGPLELTRLPRLNALQAAILAAAGVKEPRVPGVARLD